MGVGNVQILLLPLPSFKNEMAQLWPFSEYLLLLLTFSLSLSTLFDLFYTGPCIVQEGLEFVM